MVEANAAMMKHRPERHEGKLPGVRPGGGSQRGDAALFLGASPLRPEAKREKDLMYNSRVKVAAGRPCGQPHSGPAYNLYGAVRH